MEQTVQDAPDQQVSLTDPDPRSMATSGKGTAAVGYNVQIAVDAEHHLIVAHEVTNQGYDRHQLAPMAFKAQEATGCEQITALATPNNALPSLSGFRAVGVRQTIDGLRGDRYAGTRLVR